MIRRLILHLGVHKTATTALQQQLGVNKTLLSEHGISFIPLRLFRQSVGHDFNRLEVNEILMRLSDFLSDSADSLIVSDENLIGTPAMVWLEGNLYPRVTSVIKKFKACFPDAEIKVIMAFRNPAAFLPAIYSELLRHRRFITYEEFAHHVQAKGINWYKLMFNVCVEHKDVDFVFFNFDEFSKNKDAVIKDLSFELLETFESLHIYRPTLTSDTIKFLSRVPEFTPGIVRLIESEGYSPGVKFSPYSSDEVSSLRNSSMRQINKLGLLKNVRTK